MIHNLTRPLWSLHSDTFCSLFKLLQTLEGKYNELKEAMDTLTKSSVDNLLKRLMRLASRPLVEFNKHEALELVAALKYAAHDSKQEKEVYYRLVFETLRGKLDQPSGQFCKFIFPLLGDKDHEKVLDVVAKVEKSNLWQIQKSFGVGGVSKNRSYLSSRLPPRCFYCNKPGHVKAQCLQRKRYFGESNVLDFIRNPQPVPISNALNVARTSVRSFHSIWSCNCGCRVQ